MKVQCILYTVHYKEHYNKFLHRKHLVYEAIENQLTIDRELICEHVCWTNAMPTNIRRIKFVRMIHYMYFIWGFVLYYKLFFRLHRIIVTSPFILNYLLSELKSKQHYYEANIRRKTLSIQKIYA